MQDLLEIVYALTTSVLSAEQQNRLHKIIDAAHRQQMYYTCYNEKYFDKLLDELQARGRAEDIALYFCEEDNTRWLIDMRDLSIKELSTAEFALYRIDRNVVVNVAPNKNYVFEVLDQLKEI